MRRPDRSEDRTRPIVFDRDAIEQASSLNAAHTPEHGWVTLIVGQDVADQIAADQVAAALKSARADAKRHRDAQRQAAADTEANQLLVCLQDAHATHVAGFRAWLRLGYCVRRGTTSHIRIWAPCPPSKKRLQAWRDAGADPAQRPPTYFRLEAVFSQAQVEALPPPAQPVALDPPIAAVQGDSLAWALQPLQRLAGELGYRVAYARLPKVTADRVTRTRRC